MNKIIFHWSGGKDSAFCLHHILQSRQYHVDCLVTTINNRYHRVSMHGVREELLDRQAEQIGLPLHKIYLPHNISMKAYGRIMSRELRAFKDRGIRHAVFGDIFLEELRTYREKRLDEIGMQARFPLWKQPTVDLSRKFIDMGFKAIIVCVDESRLAPSFSGKIYNHRLLGELPDHIDPCGENGEFHTFVYDGPIFTSPVPFKKGNTIYRRYGAGDDSDKGSQLGTDGEAGGEIPGFWFCDLLP